MKFIIFAISFLLVLSGFSLSGAQQPSHLDIWETRIFLGEQPARRGHLFKAPPFFPITPVHPPLAKDHLKKLNAIIPDFQVNEISGPNGADQWEPAIASDKNGKFVVAWRDGRNGDWDIYAQRYSNDGSLLGTNFKINDDPGGTGQGHPSLSIP